MDVIEEDSIPILNVTLSSNKTVRQLSIKKIKEKLTIESEGIVATIESTLEINESGIYVGNEEKKTELKILPGEISKRANDDGIGIKSIELKEVNKKPVYELKGSKKGRLLGVVPVTMQIETQINANTGRIENKKEPWWSFLVKR